MIFTVEPTVRMKCLNAERRSSVSASARLLPRHGSRCTEPCRQGCPRQHQNCGVKGLVGMFDRIPLIVCSKYLLESIGVRVDCLKL